MSALAMLAASGCREAPKRGSGRRREEKSCLLLHVKMQLVSDST